MFTNPADYINHYVDILKKEYSLNDLKIDYHGFVGFIMNLFGWTNFDIKQYYDYLFREGFLETAEETKNLYLHASKYSYQLNFSSPAVASGNIIFDFSKLPVRASNVYKREVIFPSLLRINISNYPFTSLTQYKFVEERRNNQILYYAIVTPVNEKQRLISSASSVITVPFFNFSQYEIKSYQYNVPNYNYGIYSQYNLTVNTDDYLSGLTAYVKPSGSNIFEEYNIKYIKAFENSLSKALFLNRISDKQFLIETGNGYHGVWLPNAIINLNANLTKGVSANSLTRQEATIKTPSLRLVQYDENNNIIYENTITATNSLVKFDFYSSEGGENILEGLELKRDIVKWIESRDNLINKNDFFNIFSRFNKDFNIVFKKSSLVDNNFYLYRTLRNPYQELLYTTNFTYKTIDYDNTQLFTYLTSNIQYNLSSSLTPNRYYYKVVAIDKFYTSTPSNPITQVVSALDRAVVLKWNIVENAEYYKVFGRNNQYNQYWIVPKDQISTDGYVYFIDVGDEGTSGYCFNNYIINDQINFPVFDLNLPENVNLLDTTYIWKAHSTPGIYYIDNKEFWYFPLKIMYNNIELTKITNPRIDQLITNSWTIIDRKLYLKFDNQFNFTTSNVVVYYNKELSFFSPFIYKRNDFFNWFEGYFLNDNIIQYPIINLLDETYTPPIFYLNVVYDYNNDITSIFIKSYQQINDLEIKIRVEGFDTAYVDLIFDENYNAFVHNLTGFISTSITISLNCYIDGEIKLTAVTPSFQQVYAIKDQLVLLNYYDLDNSKYITNIPVLSYTSNSQIDRYYEDKDYIYSQIFDFVVESQIKQNRMQSDSVQTRFLNTTFCDSYTSTKLLKHNYNRNIILPLNMNIKIRYRTSDVDFSTQRSDIEILVAKYLQENATGINIKFYNSQIIDLIHDFNPDIISVQVKTYDSYGLELNDGIETKEETELLPLIEDKLRIVDYTSIYWWWNLETLNIELIT